MVNALVTALYIVAIASIMFYAPKFESSDSPSVFIPISILMLFVFSAAFTGFFVFGRPALWYLDGNKKRSTSASFLDNDDIFDSYARSIFRIALFKIIR